MGRVYNALVKADRLPGRERPIGRPASSAERRPAGVNSARTDAATKPAADFPVREAPTAEREDSIIEFSFNYDSAATAPTFQSDSSFSLTETPAAPRAVEPSSAQPDVESFTRRKTAESFPASPIRRATQKAPRATSQASPASQPPAQIFEEARQIANVRSLTVDPHLVALTAEDARAGERYRSLAVQVINAASRRKLKSLVVTSAEEGEGKSTVATSLAWEMAKRSERRVLLIDASLRSPSISRMLGLAQSRGWLDAADDLSCLADVMIRLDPNKLYVMAQPTPTTEAERQEAAEGISDALISSRFEKLLTGLQQRFDFIVIDAPHVLGSVDAQHLASIADGTVIVARSGVTRHSRVTAAIALVPEDRRVGIVLNESEISEEAAPHKARRSLMDRLFGRMK